MVRHSTATRECGSCLRSSSRIASDIWSQILSGCPSVTLSLVMNVFFMKIRALESLYKFIEIYLKGFCFIQCMAKDRKSEFPINRMILDRWSARAMSGEQVSAEELMPLFEAARWAPSSRNSQPWRFIYSVRDSVSWKNFFDLLVEGNREWCVRASVLIVVISQMKDERGDFGSHSFDAGSAWQNLALEGTSRGLVVHAMAGFDHDKAREVLGVPDDYAIDCMIAVGKPGNKEDLPEALRAREVLSQRKPLNEIIQKDMFLK